MTNNRESRAAISEIADLFGAKVSFHDRGKHCLVVLQWRGRTARMFISKTPSDFRAALNNLSTARKLLRQITELEPGTSATWPRFMLPRELRHGE